MPENPVQDEITDRSVFGRVKAKYPAPPEFDTVETFDFCEPLATECIQDEEETPDD